MKDYLSKLKHYYGIKKCKTWECFQGFITRLILDKEGKYEKKLKKMKIPRNEIHTRM